MEQKRHGKGMGRGIWLPVLAVFPLFLVSAGCQSGTAMEALPTERSVELERFMGDWYVHGHIPTFPEREAYNALESYELADDGKRVLTTFTFNKGALDGPRKEYHPTGFVREGTGNAVWGMQFIWPFKAEYRIMYVDDDYTSTIVGRTKRDYVWIMARSPQIPAAEYERLLAVVEAAGYDAGKVRRVPHSTNP